jgi:hypothetical protein
MAKVAEGIARVASGIAMGRRQRSELAVEIKGLTRRRRGEVRSMLDNLRASRGRATREQAAEAKKVAMVRHGEVCSLLKGLKAARGKAMREYQRDSIAIIGKRRGDMRTLLTRFGREMMVRRQHRLDLSVEQREKAAAFMRDLTSGVAALRDTFAKEGRDRAAYIHGHLAAYALDRCNAVAAWHGSYQGAGPSHRPAADAPAVQAEPPASAHASAAAHTAAAQSPDPKSGRRPFGNLGQPSSKGHHGGHSK